VDGGGAGGVDYEHFSNEFKIKIFQGITLAVFMIGYGVISGILFRIFCIFIAFRVIGRIFDVINE
jgi:hypothetical protein